MSYFDAAICRSGHVVSSTLGRPLSRLRASSTRNEEPPEPDNFCEKCGQPVLTTCPACGVTLRGVSKGIPGMFPNGSYTRPAYCRGCGMAFPWTSAALAEVERLAKSSTLTESEQAEVVEAASALVRDTETTPRAAARYSELAKKAGTTAGRALVEVATKVATQAALRYLGL